MGNVKLFMALLGCKPAGRHTEQHDIFFGVAEELKLLVPEIKAFWPEAQGRIHIDAWREVTCIDNYKINVLNRADNPALSADDVAGNKLFFINLGGYKENEFEEFHYRMLTVGSDKGVAVQNAKQTVFYKHTGFKSADSHIDDKYGIDVDDMYEIEDILPAGIKEKYIIEIVYTGAGAEDELHMGYFKLDKL